jgi:prolyl-tRNA synthetase
VALILRADHSVNEVKAQKMPGLEAGFEWITADQAMPSIVYMDRDAVGLCDVNDAPVADLRNVVEGDISPDGKGILKCARGIEVGHIFQLGDQYSKSMQMTVQNQDGQDFTPLMGCYGIGITRIVAAAIEQHHDERGILWPEEMAPFKLAIVPIGYDQNVEVKAQADAMYQQALQLGIEVVLDDRDERPGVKFADLDLIGIPHRIVVSDRLLAEGLFEYKKRGNEAVEKLSQDAMLVLLKTLT